MPTLQPAHSMSVVVEPLKELSVGIQLSTAEFAEGVVSELLFALILALAYLVGRHHATSKRKQAAILIKQAKLHSAPSQKPAAAPAEDNDDDDDDDDSEHRGRTALKAVAQAKDDHPASHQRRAPVRQGAESVVGLKSALKSAVQQRDVEATIHAFAALHSTALPQETCEEIQQSLRDAVMTLTTEAGQVPQLLDALRGGWACSRTFNSLLKECIRCGDVGHLQACKQLGEEIGIVPNTSTWTHFLNGANSSAQACAVLEEASSTGGPMRRLLEVAAERAFKTEDSALANLVLSLLPEAGLSSAGVAALLQQRADAVLRELVSSESAAVVAAAAVDASVLELYEKHFSGVDISSHPVAYDLVFNAAKRADKDELVTALVGPAKCAISAIRTAKSAVEARQTFRGFQERSSAMYAALLETLISLGDIPSASEELFVAVGNTSASDLAPCFKLVAEAQLRARRLEDAQATLACMRSAGLVPSVEMFNALLTEALKADVDWWYILPEMELDKVKPESSTCSLLLRSSVTVPRQRQHLSKVAGVFEGLGKDAADIFGLFLETCLRFNRADLLRHCLKRQRDSSPLPVRDSLTYAHLIRAYGVLEDVDGAWHAWNEMVSRNMIPLKVTVGCMVQALVTNKHVEAGYGLVRELNDDPRTGHLATAVTYNSLLKGFVVQKLFDRAWSVYTEMCDRSLVLTAMTFNTLIDACARCGHMDRIEGILNAMKEHGVEADAITYNTVIKGLCHDGRLEEALTMRTKLRQSKKHSVDGHAYAALLDGCSRLRKWELGFELIDEMQADNVLPNNVTLTALMRMAGCSRKPWALERALNLCDTVARNHRIQLNGFVYKNMVIACVTHGERVRALKVIGQAASARVLMDASTYEPLLLALASERKTLGDAAALLSLVCGLRVPRSDLHVLLRDAPMDALRAHDGFGAKSVEKVLLAMATFDREQAVHLARRLERETALRLDRRVKLQLASARGGQVP